jgi:aerobic-type carbon monoxide dehydrogenase small subunit (CoxS/CutS family)
MTARSINLRVNGLIVEAEVEVRVSLADFLRGQLGLTGTHLGCEHGVCGACTLIVDQQPVRACLMLAVQADGSDVETVESLGTREALSPLQQAFSDHHALQCGFCTPGMLMTLEAYLRDHPTPTRADIRDVLSGNLCRCTGYQGIVDAALQAAQARKVAA